MARTVSTQIFVTALTPTVMDFGDGDFGKIIKFRWGHGTVIIVLYKKTKETAELSLCSEEKPEGVMWGRKRTWTCWRPELRFSTSRTQRKETFKPASLWDFVMASQADSYTQELINFALQIKSSRRWKGDQENEKIFTKIMYLIISA